MEKNVFEQDGKVYDYRQLPKGFIVKQDVDFSRMGLEELPDMTGVIVYGNFSAAHNHLNSLVGMPLVYGDIDLSFNKISDLHGIQYHVYGSLYLSHNQLDTLKGSPIYVEADFEVDYNLLKTLEFGPKHVFGSYDCSSNPLENTKGAPKKLTNGSFYASNTNINTVQYLPKYIGICLDLSFTKLKTIEGISIVGADVDLSHNRELRSLDGLQNQINGDLILAGNKSLRKLNRPYLQIGGKLDVQGTKIPSEELSHVECKELLKDEDQPDYESVNGMIKTLKVLSFLGMLGNFFATV